MKGEIGSAHGLRAMHELSTHFGIGDGSRAV
jgi:hypothetical protein